MMTPAAAITVLSDVEALQELYKNLNYPSQLVGWKSYGRGPFGDSWTGVSCDAASVIKMIWGNEFQNGADSPPWDFPLDTILRDQNINSPPATELSAIENYPSLHVGKQRERRFSPVGIACGIVGVALVASCAAIIIAIHIKRSGVHNSQDLKGDRTVLPISTKYDNGSAPPDELPQSLPHKAPPVLVLKRLPSSRHGAAGDLSKINCFSRVYRHSLTAKSYSVDELQLATGNFKEENFLGEGSLGSVFKAQFPDGQILVVKNINTAALSIHEEEQFFYAVSNVSRLKHPNIVALVGYCIEHGRYFLVYEYVRNLSLEDALHNAVHKHLSWIMRLRIALAIARPLEYMHSACVPPVAHCKLKSANILLDNELVPHLCDCGLAALKPLTKNSINLKVPGLGMNFLGYSAPENRQTEKEEVKSDIYAFGVLLLELLTGKKPLDCLHPGKEQSLVKWASSRLHDYNSLKEMVDPTILGRYSSRSLSRFADIISLCIQFAYANRLSQSFGQQCEKLWNL